MKQRNRLFRTSVAACAALSLGACTSTLGGGESSSDEVTTIAVTSSFPDLDPHHSTSNVNYLVNFGNIYEGLVALTGDSAEAIPVLATDWEMIDDTTYRFTLREGVTFHNGVPFDAEAAAYSIDRAVNDPASAELASYLATFKSARAVDPTTVEVTTKKFEPDLLQKLSMVMMVPPKAAEADSLTRKPVGTGPYEFESKSSDSISLRPYEDHWGDTSTEQQVKVVSRPEVSTLVAGLDTGVIDIAYDIPVELVDAVPAVQSAPVQEPVILRMNGLSGVTADPKVREAINAAIDTDALREQFIGKEYASDPQCQFMGEEAVGHNPNLSSPEADADRARALVTEAGAKGKTLSLVGVQGRYPKGAEILEAVKSQLEGVGFKVSLRVLDTQGWLDQIYLGSEKAPELAMIGVNTDQWSLFQPWASIVSSKSKLSTYPNKDWPRTAKLMSKAKQTRDDGRRQELLADAAATICESNSFVWLYNYDQVWGTQEGIEWDIRKDNRILFSTIRHS